MIWRVVANVKDRRMGLYAEVYGEYCYCYEVGWDGWEDVVLWRAVLRAKLQSG